MSTTEYFSRTEVPQVNLPASSRTAAALAATGAASTGTLTTIAVADYADGDHFTIPDGTNSVKFEPRAKAVSTVTLIDLADIEDNDTLIVDDGTNDPVTFEAQVTDEPTFSTGSITCVAPANLKNNESCSIGPDNTFAFNVETAAQAAGSLTFQAKADCTDGDTFTLYSQVFEIDKTGAGVTAPNFAVDISDVGVVTANDVATVAQTVINTAFGGLTVSAADPTDGVLPLQAIGFAYADNVAITVTGTSCTAAGMAGGATEFSAGEATEVDVTTAEDVADVADAFGAAINLAAIGVTAGVPVDGVIPLTSNIPGPIEIEIIYAVSDAGFTHENITGGLAFTPTPETTRIDFSECVTEADKVTAVTDAINAATTEEGLDLVAEDDGTIITATNTATGTRTMTFTGDLVDSATAVSAGLGGAVPVAGAVEVDMTGLATATQGAAKICQVANALDASTLNVTCTSNAGVITATNGTNGSAGNAAITENVANAEFTVSGMTGGRNPLASITLDDVPDSATRVAVTPSAAAAAEALAAGTTTLASIVDSTAGAGRKAVTTAESTALALMTAAIGPLARSITVTVPAGGPYSTFDITEWSAGVPLSIPADYGIELEVCSAAGANSGWMILRANGDTAAITKGVGQTRGGNFDTAAAYLGVAEMDATSKVSAKIGPYTNGSRLFVSNTVDDGLATNCGSTRAGVAVGTITSLGVGSLSGTCVAAGSTICVRIAKDIRP